MQLLIASALAHRGFDMGEIAELKPLAERTISATLGKKIEADEYGPSVTISATLPKKKEADEYALLVLKNLHDSLKWMFTILMGGSAILAGRSLIYWADSLYSQSGIPVPDGNVASIRFEPIFPFFLFFIYALTLFRFYWGWIRYCDIKYIEVPNLLASYRDKFFEQNISNTYEVTIEMAVEYSRLPRVLVDTIPIFFQTTLTFVIAGSLNNAEIFIRTYIILLVFNSAYLTLNYNLSAYHEIALTRAFGSGLALAVTPRGSIKVWIVNNLLCAFLMWALLHEYAPGHPSLMPQAACVFVMFANCLLDLALAREMYSRRAKDLRQAVGKF
jgi:hypothetical protein